MKRLNRLRKVSLPLALTLAAVVVLAVCITALALWCQPNALRIVLAVFLEQPLLIVLNVLPVLLLLLALACLLRNVWFASALTNLCICGLSIANCMKIEMRDEPLFPRDFALLKEVGSGLGEYDLHFPMGVIAVVAATTVVLAVLGIFIGCKPFTIAKMRGWIGRVTGAAASVAVLVGLILTVYASDDLYNSFRVTNAYYVPSVFNELGFPYCFCHQFTTYSVDQPDGYSRSDAEGWDAEAVAPAGQGAPVNVIMVMNEAFSDVSDHPVFTWEEDPLPCFHALRNDPHAITGRVVVPSFAGGTANTEFDVLTGMQTNALSETTTSSMRVVNRDLDSLFRVFGADGYRTSYFHCGDDWFYNRENVLRWFGAEETVFIDQMENPEMKGRWVTDDYMAGLIEEEFEAAVEGGQRLFHYTTTIQNHMSYTIDKYGADYIYPGVEASTPLSDAVRTMMEVYVEGVRDADAMLGRLVDYFTDQDEPVVLVFFGDHLPYLGDNQLGYTEIGMSGEENWVELTSYETPYVIWANHSAAEELNWEKAAETLDLPERISAAFLGASVLELTGRMEESAWFRFLCQMRREIPVVQKNVALSAEGSLIDISSVDGEILEDVAKWRQWSYYKLQQKDMKS